ncbi:MAG: nucleotidyl transferase AbiEii/AbiGii toxin family protein [Chloroflexota bacterium]|nr:nucleotidyl transferase AbiEii/AbiGii toxin family protein [Chloroflexota bacterium]
MKSDLAHFLTTAGDPVQAFNWMREYLQARILAELQAKGAMIPLAFHGGTALRFLYQLPRFSEDLDFALERPDRGYEFLGYLESIKAKLTLEGYPVAVKYNVEKVVHSAFISFPGLLFEFGLSPYPDQNFSIKLEVDTRPPQGAGLSTSLIRHRELFLNLQHHDKASLLAGKVHAVLQRPHLKGRDIYDLVWYLSDRAWPAPNFQMLNNALAQTGWKGTFLNARNWKTALHQHLSVEEIQSARQDVEPFLARQEDIKLLTWEHISQLLS